MFKANDLLANPENKIASLDSFVQEIESELSVLELKEQMLSQMAIAMTVDLGMDKATRRPPMCSSSSEIMPFMSYSRPSAGEIEGMRAYLGCYFLTSS